MSHKNAYELEDEEKLFQSALGELCMVVSEVENLIRRFIIELISHKDIKITRLIIGEMHFHPLCTLVLKLYTYREHVTTKKINFKKFIGDILNLHKKRDEFIHSEWLIWTNNKSKRIKRLTFYPVHIAELEILIMDFYEASGKLKEFSLDWLSSHPSGEFKKVLDKLEELKQLKAKRLLENMGK